MNAPVAPTDAPKRILLTRTGQIDRCSQALVRFSANECVAEASSCSPGSSGRDMAEETTGSPKSWGSSMVRLHMFSRRRQDCSRQTIAVQQRGPWYVNSKAGEERSFWTVETNFLPGRTFDSLEDLNRQARQWATERMEQRPQTKARLIPAKLFEHERHYLHPLPAHLPAPYLVHERGTDQYGYVPFAANYYWVPGTRRDDVKLFQYAEHVKIFLRQTLLAEYPLPADGMRGQYYSPPGQPRPRHQPRNRHRDAQQEEQRLRAMGSDVAAYLDFALCACGVQRHRFTRELFALSRKVPQEVFVKAAQRALRYRIVDLSTVRRITWLCLSQEGDVLPQAEVQDDFQQRPAYQEGCLTEEPDLSAYDELFEDENEEEHEDDNRS